MFLCPYPLLGSWDSVVGIGLIIRDKMAFLEVGGGRGGGGWTQKLKALATYACCDHLQPGLSVKSRTKLNQHQTCFVICGMNTRRHLQNIANVVPLDAIQICVTVNISVSVSVSAIVFFPLLLSLLLKKSADEFPMLL